MDIYQDIVKTSINTKIPSVATGSGVDLQVLEHVVGVCIEQLGTQVQNRFIRDIFIALGCRDTRTFVTAHTLSRHCCASIAST